jgi:hypothetical protein
LRLRLDTRLVNEILNKTIMPGEELLGQALSGVGQGVADQVSGLISGITGLVQKHKANALLAQTKRPTYAIPNEVLQNQKQAELNANTGLPSEQYQQGMQNINRQQNAALQRATDRRGGLLAVAGTQQQANDATLKLDVANAQARLNNQRTLYGINNQVAGYRDKAFNINQMQPYQQNYSYAMGLLGAGNQNLISGIDKFATGGLKGMSSVFGGGGSKAGSSNPYAGLGDNSGGISNSVGPGGPIIF